MQKGTNLSIVGSTRVTKCLFLFDPLKKSKEGVEGRRQDYFRFLGAKIPVSHNSQADRKDQPIFLTLVTFFRGGGYELSPAGGTA